MELLKNKQNILKGLKINSNRAIAILLIFLIIQMKFLKVIF